MRHQAEITADEPSLGPTRHHGRDTVLPIDLTFPALERWWSPNAGGQRWLTHDTLPLAQRVRRECPPRDRTVKAHEPSLRVKRHVKRGDVAVADQRFRRAPHLSIVEKRQDARRAVPAPHAPDRVDAVIREHGVHIVGTRGIGAGEVPVPLEDVSAGADTEAERFQGFDREANVLGLVRRGRRRNEADRLTGRQPARSDHGWPDARDNAYPFFSIASISRLILTSSPTTTPPASSMRL